MVIGLIQDLQAIVRPVTGGVNPFGRKQEYNFSILVSDTPARGQLMRFQARNR